MNDVKPALTGEAQEVKVKVRINQNGILLISSAQMIEKKDAAEEQNGANEAEPQSPTEPSPAQDGQAPTTDPMDTQDVSLESFVSFLCNNFQCKSCSSSKTLSLLSPSLFSLCVFFSLSRSLTQSHLLEDDHPADQSNSR